MIESTPALALVTHMLCCSCGIYFSAAPFLGEAPGQHELGLKDGSGSFDPAVEGGRQIADQRVPDAFLDVGDHLAGVAFKPMPVEVFGDPPELDNEVSGQVLGLGFAALSPAKAGAGPPRPNP